MLKLEEIITRLEDMSLNKVAEKTDIHYNTLRSIRAGDNKNPGYIVVLKLSEYFEGQNNGV